MNPFLEKAKKPEEYIRSLKDIYPTPYDKNDVDPYTKTRIILAAGTEYEANWFSHQTMRRFDDPDFRKDLFCNSAECRRAWRGRARLF